MCIRDRREREREREMFKVNRGYEELVERLSDNEDLPCGVNSAVNDDNAVYNEHLPDNETNVAADENNGEIITYLSVTNNNKRDWTTPNVDMMYDRIIWSNPGDYYSGIVEEFEKLNSDYIGRGNIINLNQNEMYLYNIRLFFDDGG